MEINMKVTSREKLTPYISYIYIKDYIEISHVTNSMDPSPLAGAAFRHC